MNFEDNQPSPLKPKPALAWNDTANLMAIVGFVPSFFFGLVGLIFSIIGLKKKPSNSAGLDEV